MDFFVHMLLLFAIGAIGISAIELLAFLMRSLREALTVKRWAKTLLMILSAAIIIGLAAIAASYMIILPKNSIMAYVMALLGFSLFVFLSGRYGEPMTHESVSHQLALQHHFLNIASRVSENRIKALQQPNSKDEAQISERYELYMRFYSLKDLSTEEKAREFCSLLVEQGESFIPELSYKNVSCRIKSECFDRNNFDSTVRLWIEHRKNLYYNISTVVMQKKNPFLMHIVVSWNRGANAMFNEISLWMGGWCLQEPLLCLGESLFDYTGGLYGFITRYEVRQAPYLGERLDRSLPGVFWVQFLGSLYMDFFGKERILNAPCHSKKLLPDGGVLLQTAQFPTGQEVAADRESEKALIEYLNPDAFNNISEPASIFRTRRIRKNTPVFDFSEVRRGCENRKAAL
ncbi:MAG: hypothetical protein AB2L14_25905 [Candidatus Xenobiia bacterium LiM19]